MGEDINGQIAVVSGGSSGIGRGIAEKFASAGANVVILGRHEDSLKQVAKVNKNISYVVADLTQDQDIQKVANYIKNQFGKLNILVNNAGWCPVQPLSAMTIKDYDQAFSLDVRGVVALTIALLPLLKKSKKGSIINMSSIITQRPTAKFGMYAGAKAAIEAISKSWAQELAPQIRVNVISPGPIESAIWHKTDMSKKEEDQNEQRAIDESYMKRMGTPEDIAHTALFLVSDKASFITGANYLVDGGAAL